MCRDIIALVFGSNGILRMMEDPDAFYDSLEISLKRCNGKAFGYGEEVKRRATEH